MPTAVSDKEGKQLVFPSCGGWIASFNAVENEERCQTSFGFDVRWMVSINLEVRERVFALAHQVSFFSLLIMTL